MYKTTDERSLGELFSELLQDTRTLVNQEVELAKTEMSQKASSMGKHVGFIAAGGFVAYAGFLAIIAALIVGLGELMPMWLSALLVGVIVAGVGYLLVQRGLNKLKSESMAPQQTVRTLKENAQWAKEQVR
jgi:hypothetical protein